LPADAAVPYDPVSDKAGVGARHGQVRVVNDERVPVRFGEHRRAAWLQHAFDFAEHAERVGQVLPDPVGIRAVNDGISDAELVSIAAGEDDLREAMRPASGHREGSGVNVYADDTASVTDRSRHAGQVGPGAAAKIEDGVAALYPEFGDS